MKILVVDDEYAFGRLLSRTLKKLGHEPSVVAHPEDALETFRADDFDAVITDIDMPDMNGVELANRLRDEHADVPVAFCTGSEPGTNTMSDAMRIGRVLPKSWTLDQVRDVLATLNEHSTARRNKLARGSNVLIPTNANVPEVAMRRRAKTVPGRRMRRKIKVTCKRWDEVQKLCDNQSEGKNVLTIKGRHPLETGDHVTIALRLPDELVLSIAAEVERVRELGDERFSYSIRMIGLTPEMTARMRSLVLESARAKPGYIQVKQVAAGSETEINPPREGAVLGNLKLRKQIDAIGRLRPDTDNDEDSRS